MYKELRKTEKEINLLFEDDDFFYEEYNDLLFEAEKKTFENFNNDNNEFTKDENVNFFYEKRNFFKFYLITIEALFEVFIKEIERAPFKIEIEEFVTCNKELKIIG